MDNQKNIVITRQQDICGYYWYFSQFLAQFAANADVDIFDDEYIVKRSYVACERDYQEYLKVKFQANEILEMDPFPHDAIENSADRNLIQDATSEEEKVKKVKEWLHKVLDLLEKRVTGKL